MPFLKDTTLANGGCLPNYPFPGGSVIDGIDVASMSYTTVEDVASLVADSGRGSLLAKADIESAYRLILVHSQDHQLQAMEWEGQIYIDPMLPFGLRSVPRIFNTAADALHWHLHQAGIQIIRHYLDDYIIIAPSHSERCAEDLQLLLREC